MHRHPLRRRRLLPFISRVVIFGWLCSASPSLPAESGTEQKRDGFPVLDVRALVVGRDVSTVTQVSSDLQDIGFTVVTRDRIEQAFDSIDLLGPTAGQYARLIQTAFLAGAELLVVVETERELGWPTVTVKGVEVETGEVVWSGQVGRRESTDQRQQASLLTTLAHQALIEGLMAPPRHRPTASFAHP